MENFLNILVAVLLVACVPTPGEAVTPTCPTDNAAVCLDCVTRGVCGTAGDDVTAGTACPTGEACKVVSGTATCMPVAEVPQCDCDGAAIGCDGYNGDLTIFCVTSRGTTFVYPGSDCSTTGTSAMTCVAGQCAAGTAFTCATTGFFVQPPTCSSAIFCAGNVQITSVTCSAGQYFNEARAVCEAYPPNPCAGCTKSKCPIISDCTKYAVCSNGQVVDGDESCEDGKVFNSQTELCEAGPLPDEICARYADCVFPSSGSTVPTATPSSPGGGNVNNPVSTLPPCTAANADQRYPHADCERYYTCREVTRNSFRYNDSKCPSPYAFNPTILRCDVRSNVPGCPAST